MVRTDKNDSANNKLVFLSLTLTVVLCAGVAIGVFCLDFKRKEEILHLRNQLINYGEEVVYLKQQLEQHEHLINQTASSVHKIKGNSHKPTYTKPAAPEEEDYYYEENYDYDEDEDEDEDNDDTEDTTASVPFVGENMPPSQDKTLIDTNDTVSVRPKRHISEEVDDTNVLETIQGNTHHPSLFKGTTEDYRKNLNPYNRTHLPEAGQFVDLMPLYQAQGLSKESLVHLRHSRGRYKEKRESEVESMSPYDNTGTIAAHYGGDTRKYHNGRHSHYDVNDRMYHPSGLFKDWAPSEWVNTLRMNSHFMLHNGRLTVHHPGLYLVYAQIFYADVHDTSGYRLYQNNEIVAQCTTMTHSTTHVMKLNTCFTNIILLLQSSDNLHLKEIQGDRYTIFEPTKSFFGLVKLKSV